MPGREHTEITELALQLLPAEQRAFIGAAAQDLLKTYCKLPDTWYDVAGGGHERAAPYCFTTDDIPFHYIPDTPVVPLYRYYVPDVDSGRLNLQMPYQNDNWRHASRGFRFYADKSITALQNGNPDDGLAYAGWLLHMLEDYCFGGHTLEGAYGTDFFVLQRLFGVPDDPAKMPHTILAAHGVQPTADIISACRPPRLLGVTPDEIALHLYTRYVEVNTKARKLCFRIVNNSYSAKEQENETLVKEMYRNAALLCADVLYTVICNATDIGNAETAHLQQVYLSDLEPVQRPWLLSSPYRTLALVQDQALDYSGQRMPLQLLDSAAGKTLAFAKGWAMGGHSEFVLAYELPADLYESFNSRLGLHAIAADKGNVRLSLFSGGDMAYSAWFNRDHPSAQVEIRNPAGRLELKVESPDGLNNAHNHIVWAEPLLQRQAQ